MVVKDFSYARQRVRDRIRWVEILVEDVPVGVPAPELYPLPIPATPAMPYLPLGLTAWYSRRVGVTAMWYVLDLRAEYEAVTIEADAPIIFKGLGRRSHGERELPANVSYYCGVKTSRIYLRAKTGTAKVTIDAIGLRA